ncbi:MAG: hypothetical protein WCL06_02715 [Bacteroidota bacterium]
MKTRLSLIILLSFLGLRSFSQDIPSDSILLKMIYGKCDAGGKSFTRAHAKDEPEHEYYPQVSYKIALKEHMVLDNQDILFVICQAPIFYQHYHTFYLIDYCYFARSGDRWNLTKTITGIMDSALIDVDKFAIADIGPDKKALITTFASVGNGSDSRSISLQRLTLDGLINMIAIDLDYSNAAWINIESMTSSEECPIIQYESTWNIVKSDKSWYDIHVSKTNYGFSKGCKDKFVSSKEESVYSYIQGGYKQQTDQK